MMDRFRLPEGLVPAVDLPPLYRVRQRFEQPPPEVIDESIARELSRPEIAAVLQPGLTAAIGVGSRGIAGIAAIVGALVRELRRRGVEPFLVPAMGSHGGATAEGQVAVLAELGVTAEAVGAPFRATMETVVIATLPDGTPLHMDREAAAADLIIPVNRIKSHGDFHGPVESGLCKMTVIGLGKQKGASTLHACGPDRFAELIPAAAAAIVKAAPIPFGIAVVEDAYQNIARLEAVPAADLVQRESALLKLAKRISARLPFAQFDVLIVDEIGKEVSGDGIDPNVTGRYGVRYIQDGPKIQRCAVLGLTEHTQGNGCGIGLADITTARLFEEIDFGQTYMNTVTATVIECARIPVVAPDDRTAVAMAIQTSWRANAENVKLVRIKNTARLEEVCLSPALWALAREEGRSDLEYISGPHPWTFDAAGRIAPFESW
jgi:hypothetical protein